MNQDYSPKSDAHSVLKFSIRLKRTRGLSVNQSSRENEDELHGHQAALHHPRTRWLPRYLASAAKNGTPEMFTA